MSMTNYSTRRVAGSQAQSDASQPATRLRAVVAAPNPVTDAPVSGLSDDDLLRSVAELEQVIRDAHVRQALLASEVARRSRPELGHQGLAARQGHSNAAALLRALTRSSLHDASRRIRVGGMLDETAAARELGEQTEFDGLSDAVADGRLAIGGADGIVRVLEPVVGQVDPQLLQDATTILAQESGSRHADDLQSLARGVRDTLDRAGLVDREQQLRERRSLRRGPIVDGMRRVTLLLDPESDAIILGAVDHAMSPRLGGPRFVDLEDKERAARLIEDDRTNEQLALDVLADLVRIGVDRDDGRILGGNRPGLRVTMSLADLERRVEGLGDSDTAGDPDASLVGVARIEGSDDPVSAATARRILCDAGALPIVLGGSSEPLDLGRTRRLFSHAQRVALAERDGGCRGGDCDRPPSWCEAHHINPFASTGKTDLADGILLCRRHHLIFHTHGWQMIRGQSPGDFLLIPPKSVDTVQTPRPLPRARPRWAGSG